ncbi:MAG: hypothetical protein IPG88_24640, partial [Gemmatimonadetes bacterium]|nr:hypothetical protein [Gemmatimonadota bacterium]
TITASLAGWRRTERPFPVVGQPPVTLFREGWDASWDARWIAVGDPRPRVVTGPGKERALWNAGDGVSQRRRPATGIDAREGLGVEIGAVDPDHALPAARPHLLRRRDRLRRTRRRRPRKGRPR